MPVRSKISQDRHPIAYLSMEIALDPRIPTYSGGLGVLAGDTIRSAADLALPMVAVTLLYRRGYFEQSLDRNGCQRQRPVSWQPEDLLEPLRTQVAVEIGGRNVQLRAWRYPIHGCNGGRVPAYLLDSDLPENAAADRSLTDCLYAGDEAHRLRQEAVLGIGGMRLLRALGYAELRRVHMNEGHAALAVLALLQEIEQEPPADEAKRRACLASVRTQCVFTTHTPVPAGHDKFPAELARRVLGKSCWRWLEAIGQRGSLNLTELALESSGFVNGVAMRHGEVSRGMFPHYPIRSITNGIHPASWASPAMGAVLDRHVPDWRQDAFALRYAVGIPKLEIWRAHSLAKQQLLTRVQAETGMGFEGEVFTLGFARRATAYKRAALIFRDLKRLRELVRRAGPLQLVFAGKAHPRDRAGRALIRDIFKASKALRGEIRVAYLTNYDIELGRLLCAGVDVWLNNPVPPLEASGTSGMKAALNGVPSLSILDGWWVEGCIPGVTGWAIGRDGGHLELAERDEADATALYEALETLVLPSYYQERDRFLEMMRSSISLNASFFNTQRMVLQYLYDAYTGPDEAVLNMPDAH